METKTITQLIEIQASPHAVYEALMDSEKHSVMTGDTAEISPEVGGRFSAFSGYCEGVNMELVPDTKIVQTWRASDWPADHYSEVTFLLNKRESGTEINFTHKGVPDEQYDDISQGWYDNYWTPMKEMLEV